MTKILTVLVLAALSLSGVAVAAQLRVSRAHPSAAEHCVETYGVVVLGHQIPPTEYCVPA